MRASRLLRLLLLLQNRGRMTCARLATELEVTVRTVLRDVDALTEAGLPIIVHRGSHGGIELGFNYRTRLLGLALDEAEALALILRRPAPELVALGLHDAGARAAEKILASLPDALKARAELASEQVRFDPIDQPPPDPGIAALAAAVRQSRIVWIARAGHDPQELHPSALVVGAGGWRILDARPGRGAIALCDIVAIQISRHTYR